MNNLKPCPFCGGEARRYCGHIDFYGITCTKCSAKIYGHESKASATRAWNKRAKDEVKHGKWIWKETGEADYEQFFECSICKGGNYYTTKHCPECGAKMDGKDDENGIKKQNN